MRGEVDTLRDTGLVAARTAFPDSREFRYTVESTPETAHPGAIFADNAIIVRLPETQVQAWANSEQVSITGEQALNDSGSLSILVEKDFACLAPRPGEDESDMFEHPATLDT